jgi:hypothetical protein
MLTRRRVALAVPTSRRVRLALLACLGALASVPAQAGAGEYGVSVCRHADGSIAPTDGWQFAIADDFAANDLATDTCSLGGSLDLQLREGTMHGRLLGPGYSGASVSVAATPPPGTAWSRADVWWAFRSNPTTAAGGSEQIAGSINGLPQTICAWGSEAISPCSARGAIAGPALSEANRTAVELGGSTGSLVLLATCSSAPLACPSTDASPYAQLRAWRLRLTLADNSPPAFDAQPALQGTFAGTTMAVAVSATDAGSGVRTAQAVVDGAPVGTPSVLDSAGGRCVQHPDGTFGYMVPCRLSLSSATAALDLAAVPNGLHAIAVRIADAAGNVADSVATPVSIDNPPPPVPLAAIPLDNPLRGQGRVHNGTGSASSGTLTAGPRVIHTPVRGSYRPTARLAYGHRAQLAGKLVGADGRPVAGAILTVTSTAPGSGSRSFTVRTAADGRYLRVMQWGRSRGIVVTWYPWGDSTQPAARAAVRLLGQARVTMRVSPLRPRNGQSLVLTGSVGGAPAGARVTIQVRDGRVWRTFLTPRIDRRGRYVGRRLLRRSAGLSYCLRARVLSQPGFAYVAGSSKTVCRSVRR